MMSANLWRALLLLPMSLCFAGCMFLKVSREELVGKYRLDLPDGGVELLQLKTDGSCIQEIHLRGKIYEAHGTWKYFQKHQTVIIHGIRDSLLYNGKIDPAVFGSPSLDVDSAPSVIRSIEGRVQIMSTEEVSYNKVE